MEHACHKCGATIEDGTPFCAHCGAPQIRVMAAAQPSTARSSSNGSALPLPPPSLTLPELGRVSWSRAWRAANLAAALGALAAIAVALATGLPTLGFLVWMLGGGMLAVAVYRRRQRLARITTGLGARLGALAGLMGFVIFGLLSLVQMLALRGTGKFQAALEQALKTSVERSGDPQAQQMLQQFMTPEGMRLLLILGIVLMLVLFVAVASVGGAIAAALSGTRETRSL